MDTGHNRCAFTSAPAKRAFTLIELLVVVTIIALLMALITPLIGTLRASAKRVACLATLRQVHLALVDYGNDNDERLPLAYVGGVKQQNYAYMLSSAPGGFMNLWWADMVDTSRAFYCRAVTEPYHLFNNALNPWPPGGGVHTRAAYGLRPMVNNTAVANGLPRAHMLRPRTVVANDLVHFQPYWTRKTHRNGINVVRIEGAAGWVPVSLVQAAVDLLPPGATTSSGYNAAMDGVYTALDGVDR